jgi:hypothetical protein
MILKDVPERIRLNVPGPEFFGKGNKSVADQ